MDSSSKKISFTVVTPSFNQLEHLKRCALSVEDQKGDFNLEYLVHDGQSGPLFDNWASQQSFAKCISEQDSGMYDAINRGFARAEGDILAWLNCDEQYLPNTIATVARFFNENPDVDILFGDIVIVSVNGTPLGYRHVVKPLTGHIRSCFLSTFSAATFVRRKVIEDGHLLATQFRAISDAVWIDSLLRANYRCKVINEPLAVFTQTGNNLGQTSISKEEGRRWRKTDGCPGKMRRLYWSTLHRLRKAMSGAYRTRDIKVEIYYGFDTSRTERRALVCERWIK